MDHPIKKIYIAQPRGFCAGVDRAIDIVDLALELYGTPLYVKHAIVHNTHVVKTFEKKGVVLIDRIQEIPERSIVIFSAHGSPISEFEEAKNRNLTVIDATCPLVTKVHLEVKRFSRLGYDIIMIGHKGHVEPLGTLGNAAEGSKTFLVETPEEAERLIVPQDKKIAVVTQTTLSVDETEKVFTVLKRRFPAAEFSKKEDICYATTNRQEAVKKILPCIDALFVVGSQTSSNSNRLRELGERERIPSFLVDDISMIHPDTVKSVTAIGVTSGASVPEYLFESVIAYFVSQGFLLEDAIKKSQEDVHFSLPPELIAQAREQKRGQAIVEKHEIRRGKRMRV